MDNYILNFHLGVISQDILSQNVYVIQSDESKCTRILLNSAKLLVDKGQSLLSNWVRL